jgi:hypothetical protein
MGRQVVSSATNHQIDLSNTAKGIYHIKITDRNGKIYLNKFLIR